MLLRDASSGMERSGDDDGTVVQCRVVYGTVRALIGSEAVMNAVIIIVVVVVVVVVIDIVSCCVAVSTWKLLPSAEEEIRTKGKAKKKRVGRSAALPGDDSNSSGSRLLMILLQV